MGFEIDILGVGNESKGGDAIAFRYGNLLDNKIQQKVIVVDGGYKENGDELYELITKKYKTTQIYLAILTHPDNDHVRGLKRLFEYNDIKVDKLIMHCPWDNDDVINSDFKDGRITENSIKERLKNTFCCAYELTEIARNKGTTIIEPCNGRYNLEMNAILNILGPNNDWYLDKIIESDKTPLCEGTESKTWTFSASVEFEDYIQGKEVEWIYNDTHTTPINETSVVSLFEYDNIRVLFTGDVGREGLKLAVEEAENRNLSINDLTIFISPHHGSRKNITPELMDIIKSDYTFLSTPKKGDPHHPSRRLVNKFIEKGHQVFSNDGITMHWGKDCPERNWNKKIKLSYHKKIERNA